MEVSSRALRPRLLDVGETVVTCEYFFPDFLSAILVYIERMLMHNFTYIVALQRYIFVWSLYLRFKDYFKLFIGMHEVTNFPRIGYVVTLHGTKCYITLSQQYTCTTSFF